MVYTFYMAISSLTISRVKWIYDITQIGSLCLSIQLLSVESPFQFLFLLICHIKHNGTIFHIPYFWKSWTFNAKIETLLSLFYASHQFIYQNHNTKLYHSYHKWTIHKQVTNINTILVANITLIYNKQYLI